MLPIITRLRVPAGFLLAGLYFWLAHPTWPLWPAGIALAFLGMLFRGWAAGHVRKNDQLAVSGPYAFTRHPLYLGSLVIGLGFSLAGRSLPILVLLLACFFLLYPSGHAGRGGAPKTTLPPALSRLPEDRPLLSPHPLADQPGTVGVQSATLPAQPRVPGGAGIRRRPGPAPLEGLVVLR